MIEIFVLILLFSILGSIGAICAAAVLVFIGEKYQKLIIPILIAFATGILLTASLLGLIPEAIEAVEGDPPTGVGAYLIMPYEFCFFLFLKKLLFGEIVGIKSVKSIHMLQDLLFF